MAREQIEQVLESVKAQLRWATLHDGDQELLALLRFERDRFSLATWQRKGNRHA